MHALVDRVSYEIQILLPLSMYSIKEYVDSRVNKT